MGRGVWAAPPLRWSVLGSAGARVCVGGAGVLRDIERVLIDEARIAARVREIAAVLAGELVGELEREGVNEPEGHVAFIPIMTGAMVFTADLIRRLPLKLSLELVAVSSYPGATVESRGAKMASALPEGLGGKHVVVIDDILDSGRTLAMVTGLIRERRPASLRSVVLLNKPARRSVEVAADHVGFEVPDEFVVGYGLDYDGYYRNLPFIGTLRAGGAGAG